MQAEDLTEAQRNFMLRYLFQANVQHMIYRFRVIASCTNMRTRYIRAGPSRFASVESARLVR